MARLSDLDVDLEHWCFACGRLDPAGMHLDFDVSRGRAETRYVGIQRHQGYDGTLRYAASTGAFERVRDAVAREEALVAKKPGHGRT